MIKSGFVTLAILSLGAALLLVAGTTRDSAEDDVRLRIKSKGKIGYINSTGEAVIAPVFEEGQEFSEGFCAVRSGGRFGFIDKQGQWVIRPTFDYATQFVEGLALVYNDGKPQFIDPSGKTMIKERYASMEFFSGGLSRVRTYTEKSGLIDKSGKLVIDTVYSSIGKFVNSMAVVTGLRHYHYAPKGVKEKSEIGVIDQNGKMLIPFGKYRSIEGPEEGLFKVEIPGKKKNTYSEALINASGTVVYALPAIDYCWFRGTINSGILRATSPVDPGKPSVNDLHECYITTSGKEVFCIGEGQYGDNFSEGFAFVMLDHQKYILINRNGKMASNDTYLDRMEFNNGKAFVETKEGWGIIDTLGQFILKPVFRDIDYDGIIEDRIFFSDSARNHNGERLYGMADFTGKVLLPSVMEDYDRKFNDGFVRGIVDGKLCWFSKDGKKIWQEEAWEPEDLQALNIDYMNRGYFHVPYDYDPEVKLEPVYLSDRITAANDFQPTALTVSALRDRQVVIDEKIKGMSVLISNTTSDTLLFNAQDGRLYMKIQAQDSKGMWRDIEYLPSSWCGNSYHTIALAPNSYWTFTAPVYEGTFQTKLRIELTYIDSKDKSKKNDRGKKQVVVYSNTFSGSVNPGQFWRKPGYAPAGIMNPYND